MYSIHKRNVGASLIEINEGISELLDKQVDTENENLKIKILGFTQSPCKVCDENKESRRRRKKDDCRITIVLLKEGLYKAVSRRLAGPISMNFGLLILH